MSNRSAVAVLLACGGLTAFAHAQNPAPAVPELLDFSLAEPALPAAAGQPFQTVVPLGNQLVQLDLEPHSVRSVDFQLLVDHGDGQLVPTEPAPPATYRGVVAGRPGSQVAASLLDAGLTATVYLPDGSVWHVEPLSGLMDDASPLLAATHAVYRDQDVSPIPDFCGTDTLAGLDVGGEEPPAAAAGGVASGTGLEIVELGADADVEFYQDNGSSVNAVMADIENVINLVDNIYETQLNLTFDLSTIVVRTGPISSDPYSSSNCNTLLDQFRTAWATTPESSIKRDVAELFTGKNLSGCLGIAFLGTVCQTASGFGYSVVESDAAGSIAARAALSAHEIGHSFNALHCCGSCVPPGAGCLTCRIMCPCLGGCSGLITSFGDTAVSQISSYAAGLFCIHDLPAPLLLPFSDEFPVGAINPNNWIYVDGASVTSAASNPPSPPNTLRLEAFGFGNEYQQHEIRSNFIDLSEETAGVLVFHSQHSGVENGERLIVEYWGGTAVDLWQPLLTVTSDGVDETEFTQHAVDLTELTPTPFHNEFRLRFRTQVDQSGDGSDDNWFVDDVTIDVVPPPANDDCANAETVAGGVTPFSTLAASTDGFFLTCEPGGEDNVFNDVWFRYTSPGTGEATFSVCENADFDTQLAVYFGVDPENCPPTNLVACSDDAPGCGQTSELTLFVGQGLDYLVRIGSVPGGEGTGMLTITDPPVPCPWDFDGDGTVGTTDFLELLANWGDCPAPCPWDFDGDGTVGTTDFLELLANWGDCA